MRRLNYHEQKLLKKTDLYHFPGERDGDLIALKKYHIQNREDLVSYKVICGEIQKLARMLAKLDAKDPFRIQQTDQLLEKLYNMGIPTVIHLAPLRTIPVQINYN
eukprot:TRINITY_DN8482_c0_g1_i2.p1 TRINITY_DN8482_c0_g1~~TRINITY_DN8482_c0_g1_i2.p1  ORF type:complete len:114 (-),score=17.04 TRINITY_DN8482_c0_g1_i2:84-398(-)